MCAPNPPSSKMHAGTVKSYSVVKGYGFILANDISQDVWFARESLREELRTSDIAGTPVYFELMHAPDGKPQAKNLVPMGPVGSIGASAMAGAGVAGAPMGVAAVGRPMGTMGSMNVAGLTPMGGLAAMSGTAAGTGAVNGAAMGSATMPGAVLGGGGLPNMPGYPPNLLAAKGLLMGKGGLGIGMPGAGLMGLGRGLLLGKGLFGKGGIEIPRPKRALSPHAGSRAIREALKAEMAEKQGQGSESGSRSSSSRSSKSSKRSKSSHSRSKKRKKKKKRRKSPSKSASISSSSSSSSSKRSRSRSRRRSKASGAKEGTGAANTSTAANAASPEIEKAKKEVLEELKKLQGVEPKDARMKAWRTLLRAWHPDKNPEKAEVATAVFQFLQKGKVLLNLK